MKNVSNYIKNKENPFEVMNPEAKYWIGYIFADGHITYNEETRNYSISLFSKDEAIMRDFQKFIGEKAHFYKRPSGICQVAYNSKPITYWFMNTFNVGEKKALTLNPTVDLDWNIIHGYFDGDGCIRMSLSKKRWKRYEAKFTTGSIVWANRLKDFLEKEGILSTLKQKNNAWDVNILGKANVFLLYTKMYESDTSKLEYKYNQFVSLFSNE